MICLTYNFVATPAGISVYTPSNTGPFTPRAAPSPSGMSTHQYTISPRQQSPLNFSPAFNMNMTSPPSMLSNPEIFSAPPTPVVEHTDRLMMEDFKSVYPGAVPPSPALSISSIVQAPTSGFTGQSPAPVLIHQYLPRLVLGSGLDQPSLEANIDASLPIEQIQLVSQLSLPTQLRYGETEEYNLICDLSAAETTYGTSHQLALSISLKLADVYLDQGRYSAAERIIRRVIGAYSNGNDGEGDEIRRLDALDLLSETLDFQGFFSEAEKVSLYTVKSRQLKLGDSHIDTFRSMNTLIRIYIDLGKLNDAEDLAANVATNGERYLGSEHPEVLEAQDLLGTIYRMTGCFEKAEVILTQALDTRRRVLGEEHLGTVCSKHNLAITFYRQERWSEAEVLQLQTLAIRKRVQGHEHPDTLLVMASLGRTYSGQELWSKAETLLVRSLETGKRVLGEEHPTTLHFMVNLGLNYFRQGHWSEAEALLLQILEISKKVLGEEHPDTLLRMWNLALTWKNLSQDEDAKKLMVQCAKLMAVKLGDDHPDTKYAVQILREWGVFEFKK
jgi:tetratricopeptide (TPR) repeat protein